MARLEIQSLLNKKFSNKEGEDTTQLTNIVKEDEGLNQQWTDVVNRESGSKENGGIGPLDIKEVSWCAYMINDNKVKESETIIIGDVDPPYGNEKQLEDEKSSGGGETMRVKSLSDAMNKFTDFMCREVIMKSYACKLIVEGNWVMDPYLKL